MQDVDPPVAPPPVDTRRQDVARRLAALLFVGAFLLDVFGNPEFLVLVSRWCAL